MDLIQKSLISPLEKILIESIEIGAERKLNRVLLWQTRMVPVM